MQFFLTETASTDACVSCTVQMELTASEVQVSADRSCDLVGIEPGYLEGQAISMGGADGVLWMAMEDGWEPVGEVVQELGRFDFEVAFE